MEKSKDNWTVDENLNAYVITSKSILRNYQLDAITKWIENGYNGIFEMATGSGKTITAISGIYKLWEEKKQLITIIGVPDKYLITQWVNNLKPYIKNIVQVSSSVPKWEKKLKQYIEFYHQKIISSLIIIVTRQSLHKVISYFIDNRQRNILLIADEVHWTGANEAKALLNRFNPDYRLGLSATPYRYFDPYGSDFVYKYFSNVVYKFSIKDGQERNFLASYEYLPIICNLDDEEITKYERITQIMKRLDPDEDEEDFKLLAIKRGKILKLAYSKIPALDRLIQSLKNQKKIHNLVLFAEEKKQYDRVIDVLKKNNIMFKDFIAETSIKERKKVIYDLENKIINAVVSKRCLDQGVDIPSLQMGIFLSSTGNPRQFIQRAGRLIRKAKGKKEPVKIYDLIVLPPTDLSGTFLYDNIIKVEYRRIGYFLKNAVEISKLNTFNKLWTASKDPNLKTIFDENLEGENINYE